MVKCRFTGHFRRTAMVMMYLFPGLMCAGQGVPDARSRSLGNVRTAAGDRWAGANNPAGLLRQDGLYAGITSMHHYFIKEMKDLNFMIHYENNDHGLGMAGNVTGAYDFVEQHYSLSYGRLFSPVFSAGLSLNYSHLKAGQSGYLSRAATFKIGLQYTPDERLAISFIGDNPFGWAYSSSRNDHPPVSYTGGISYRTGHILLVSEIGTGTEWALELKGGLEYDYAGKFRLRAGAASHPFRFTAGAGVETTRLVADISTEYHSYLGFSPSLSLLFKFRKEDHEKD